MDININKANITIILNIKIVGIIILHCFNITLVEKRGIYTKDTNNYYVGINNNIVNLKYVVDSITLRDLF